MNGAEQLYFLQPAQLISLSFFVFLSFWDKDDVDSGHLDSRGGCCTAVAASPALLAMRRQLRQLQQPQVACKEVVSHFHSDQRQEAKDTRVLVVRENAPHGLTKL